VSVEVIDPRMLVPLDVECIRLSVQKTGRLIVVDESAPTCSMASEIVASVVENWATHQALRAPARRVTMPAVPVPFSPPLEDFVLPDQARIAAAIRGRGVYAAPGRHTRRAVENRRTRCAGPAPRPDRIHHAAW
jgi:pyruvate/2-oxoglutarate/acetoin dehydrogenase E1 component